MSIIATQFSNNHIVHLMIIAHRTLDIAHRTLDIAHRTSHIGHVHICPSNKRIPKQLMYGELEGGRRLAGGQKKRFKDTLKVSLKCFDIDNTCLESLAQDRQMWRCNSKRGTRIAENHRIVESQRKRAARKDRAHNTHMSNLDHVCPTCGRGFCSRIGLYSHLRTHQRGATVHV